jgi:hypothetical protein
MRCRYCASRWPALRKRWKGCWLEPTLEQRVHLQLVPARQPEQELQAWPLRARELQVWQLEQLAWLQQAWRLRAWQQAFSRPAWQRVLLRVWRQQAWPPMPRLAWQLQVCSRVWPELL